MDMNLDMGLMTTDMVVTELTPLLDQEQPADLEHMDPHTDHPVQDQDHQLDLIPLQAHHDQDKDKDNKEDQTPDPDHLQDQGPHALVQDNVPQLDHKTITVTITMVPITPDPHALEVDMVEDPHLTQEAIPHTQAMVDMETMTTRTLTTDMTAHTLHLTMLIHSTPLDLNWYPTKAPLLEVTILTLLHTDLIIANLDT